MTFRPTVHAPRKPNTRNSVAAVVFRTRRDPTAGPNATPVDDPPILNPTNTATTTPTIVSSATIFLCMRMSRSPPNIISGLSITEKPCRYWLISLNNVRRSSSFSLRSRGMQIGSVSTTPLKSSKQVITCRVLNRTRKSCRMACSVQGSSARSIKPNDRANQAVTSLIFVKSDVNDTEGERNISVTFGQIVNSLLCCQY